MGIFDRIRASWADAKAEVNASSAPLAVPPPPRIWPSKPTVRYDVGLDCVGESFYREAILSVLDGADHYSGVAVLIPDPENPHDRNAVCVYIGGLQVGHLPKEQAADLGKRIRADIETLGVVAVAAQVTAWGNGMYQVVLEPGAAGPMSRQGIRDTLIAAGYSPRVDDWGFTMRPDGDRYKVFCSGAGGDEREEYVPRYAKALRDAGYKARVAREDGYPYVSVTGVE